MDGDQEAHRSKAHSKVIPKKSTALPSRASGARCYVSCNDNEADVKQQRVQQPDPVCGCEHTPERVALAMRFDLSS